MAGLLLRLLCLLEAELADCVLGPSATPLLSRPCLQRQPGEPGWAPHVGLLGSALPSNSLEAPLGRTLSFRSVLGIDASLARG
jgi:hypothetical protein